MGRAPCCDKTKVKRGPWSPEEDDTLKNYLNQYGTGGNWIALPHKAGLNRCGKSCRLRWLNYLRPDIKHGGFTEEEDNIICTLYNSIGSRWSVIASKLQGRTDNDVKNYWNTKLKKKLVSAKTSFHCNNETIKHTNQSNFAQIQKTNNYGNFSTNCFNASSSALPYPMDSNSNSNSVNWQRFDSSHDQLNLEQNQFPKLSHVEAVSNLSISSSADQNGSIVSTSLDLENSFGLCSSNGGINHEDEVLKHLGFDSCNDVFLNDFGF